MLCSCSIKTIQVGLFLSLVLGGGFRSQDDDTAARNGRYAMIDRKYPHPPSIKVPPLIRLTGNITSAAADITLCFVDRWNHASLLLPGTTYGVYLVWAMATSITTASHSP